MATVYGANQTLVEAGSKAAPGTRNGHVKILMDSFAFGAAVHATSTVIKIGTLPKGAKIIGGGLDVDNTGTTGKFTLGSLADPDGIVIEADSGGQAALTKGLGALVGKPALDAELDIYISCTEATDASTNDSIRGWVEFIVD